MLSQQLWSRTYEGSQKSVPDEALLQLLGTAATDEAVKRVARLQVDRRLRNYEDLTRAENDVPVDQSFLVARGCEPAAATRLLERYGRRRHQVSLNSSPEHRLALLVARQMAHMRSETKQFVQKTEARLDRITRAVDRLHLKHAKCSSLARRVR